MCQFAAFVTSFCIIGGVSITIGIVLGWTECAIGDDFFGYIPDRGVSIPISTVLLLVCVLLALCCTGWCIQNMTLTMLVCQFGLCLSIAVFGISFSIISLTKELDCISPYLVLAGSFFHSLCAVMNIVYLHRYFRDHIFTDSSYSTLGRATFRTYDALISNENENALLNPQPSVPGHTYDTISVSSSRRSQDQGRSSVRTNTGGKSPYSSLVFQSPDIKESNA